jgi:hypothetical protein
MPQSLSELRVNEISLVDAPACRQVVDGKKIPRATVAIWKRDSSNFDDVLKAAKGVKFLIGSKDDVSKVQSVVFDAAQWNETSAKKWLTDNIFKAETMDKTEKTLRFRQEDAGQFTRFTVVDSGQFQKAEAEEWDDKDETCKAVDGKTYDGTSYPKSDFAYTPTDTPSDWKLRLTKTPGGRPDAGIVGAAVAALGKGFRGKKVIIPADALPGVKAKVSAAWHKANPDRKEEELPPILKSEQGENNTMTLAELETKVTKLDENVVSLTSERDVLKAENALVLKMSKKERKLYASMDEAKRKDYMTADEQKRKALLDGAQSQKRQKKLCDTMDEATKGAFEKAGPKERATMLADADAKCKAAKAGKKKSGSKSVPKPGDADFDPDGDDDNDSGDDEATKTLTKKLAAAEDKIAKNDAQLEVMTKRDRLVSFTKRAESELPNTPGTPEEKGDILMKLADSFGEKSETFTKMLSQLKKADEAFKSSFSEIGKTGGNIPAAAAWMAKVAEIQKRDNISEGQASLKAYEEAPDLVMDYDRQRPAMRV